MERIYADRTRFVNLSTETDPDTLLAVKDDEVVQVEIGATWTGTTIPMDKIFGAKNNTPSWNATYTLGTIIDGASAMAVIDTTGETDFPEITGADLLDGSDFEADAIFEMYVYAVGTDVRYYFLYIKPA
jgi:hypothetical protein